MIRGEIIGFIERICDTCGNELNNSLMKKLIVFESEGKIRKICKECFMEEFKVPPEMMGKLLNNLFGSLNKKGVNMENSKFSQDDS